MSEEIKNNFRKKSYRPWEGMQLLNPEISEAISGRKEPGHHLPSAPIKNPASSLSLKQRRLEGVNKESKEVLEELTNSTSMLTIGGFLSPTTDIFVNNNSNGKKIAELMSKLQSKKNEAMDLTHAIKLEKAIALAEQASLEKRNAEEAKLIAEQTTNNVLAKSEQLTKELEHAVYLSKTAQEQKELAEQKKQELQEKISQHQKTLDAANKEKIEANKRLKLLESELLAKQNSIESLNSSYAKLQQKLDDKQKHIKNLNNAPQKVKNKYSKQIIKLESKLKSITKSKSKIYNQYKRTLAKQKESLNKINHLQKTLAKQKNSSKHSVAIATDLLNAEINQLQRQLSNKENKENTQKLVICNLEKELSESIKSNKGLNSIIKAQEQKIASYKNIILNERKLKDIEKQKATSLNKKLQEGKVLLEVAQQSLQATNRKIELILRFISNTLGKLGINFSFN